MSRLDKDHNPNNLDTLERSVSIRDTPFRFTSEHPFFANAGLWIEAGALEVGDRVYDSTGRTGWVEGVELVSQPQVMYNLTVAEAHTFFVGVGRWLVHNDSCDIHWPSKPHGVSAHWERMVKVVENLASSGRFTDIYVNKSITTATNGLVQSGFRPDIMARTASGRFFLVEVVSPSQTPRELAAKMLIMRSLLGDLYEAGDVIMP